MYSLIKRLFFNDAKIKIFSIIRMADDKVAERVFFVSQGNSVDVTATHSMICLDPFCIAVWLSCGHPALFDLNHANIEFRKGKQVNAQLKVSLIEKIIVAGCEMLLYKIEKVRNCQSNFLRRFVLFSYLLRNKTSSYWDRRVISALYSYPRKVIIVSYSDEEHHNIFPMDIQGFAEEAGLYVLGLRTTNHTLDRILTTKKVVVCDTDSVDVNVVYTLGKHASAAPPKIEDLPFKVTNSEVFKFPIPDFTGSYKEIEIIYNRKMGYHMLMIGKVLNSKVMKQNTASLYHIGFLESFINNYCSIDGQY